MKVVLNIDVIPEEGQTQAEAEAFIYECLTQALVTDEGSFFDVFGEETGDPLEEEEGHSDPCFESESRPNQPPN